MQHFIDNYCLIQRTGESPHCMYRLYRYTVEKRMSNKEVIVRSVPLITTCKNIWGKNVN